MPNTFRSILVTATTSLSNVYTANSGVTTIVIGAQACNGIGSTVTLTAKVANATTNTHLANAVAIPPNAALSFISGKLVLETGESLQVSTNSNNNVQITLSLLEIT